MSTLTKQIQEMARQAKRLGFSRNKAARHAPIKESLHKVFMDEYDRFKPKKSIA